MLKTKHINGLDNSPVYDELMLLVNSEIRNIREHIGTMLYKVNCSLLKEQKYEEWGGKEQAIEAYKLWTGEEPKDDRTNNTTKVS